MWFNKIGFKFSLFALIVLQSALYYDLADAKGSKYNPKYKRYAWPYVEESSGNSTLIRCFTEIRPEQLEHYFVVDLSTTEREGTCMIRLPQDTSFEFVNVDFVKPTTSTHLLIGDNRYRPRIRTFMITKDTPKSEYKSFFTLSCRHNYFVVNFSLPKDTVVFRLHEYRAAEYVIDPTECVYDEDL